MHTHFHVTTIIPWWVVRAHSFCVLLEGRSWTCNRYLQHCSPSFHSEQVKCYGEFNTFLSELKDTGETEEGDEKIGKHLLFFVLAFVPVYHLCAALLTASLQHEHWNLFTWSRMQPKGSHVTSLLIWTRGPSKIMRWNLRIELCAPMVRASSFIDMCASQLIYIYSI